MAIHLAGLVSGNDYQSMVDQLMDVKRIPIDSKQSDMEELDYDLGAWSQLNEIAVELTDSLDTLRGYDLWSDMNVSSTDETTVTATAAAAAAEQSYTVIISNLAASQSISSNQLDTSTDLVTGGYVNEGDIFEIEGQEITIGAEETLSTLRTKINNAADEMDEAVRVTATIINNHLVLTRDQTGASDVSLSDVSGSALQGLGVLDGSGLILNERTEGKDATFSINGIPVTRSENKELTDVIDGVTLNLQGSGACTLTVEPDREAAKAAILDFVEKYNTFAEQVDSYGKIALGSSSELVQKGELYGDVLLNSIDGSIRKFATAVESETLNSVNAGYQDDGVDNIMDSLNDLGIWTTGESNRLSVLDEEKLDERLEYNYDLVEQLFKGTYNSEEVAYTGGVASDFYQYMNRISQSLTGDIAQQIESMTTKYDKLADEIDELEAGLEEYEMKQWQYFTRMEDALAQMDSQLGYITSVFKLKSD